MVMRRSAKSLSQVRFLREAHIFRGIAQFGRAGGLGPSGREFESSCPDHLKFDIPQILLYNIYIR